MHFENKKLTRRRLYSSSFKRKDSKIGIFMDEEDKQKIIHINE